MYTSVASLINHVRRYKLTCTIYRPQGIFIQLVQAAAAGAS